jgi:ammonia channel protein AmtB
MLSVVATYMKNIIDFVLGALSALLFGYGIAYAQWPLMHEMDAWKFFFHLVFQATASTIVSGQLAGTLARPT